MSTYNELIYLTQKELKGQSDDFSFTDEYLLFLLIKYRNMYLINRYTTAKRIMDDSNKQKLEINLVLDNTFIDPVLGETQHLSSNIKIPKFLNLSKPIVYTNSFYSSNITYVTPFRFSYVGHNKFLQNIIYCTINPSDKLILRSSNPQYKYLKKVTIYNVFQNILEVSKLNLPENSTIDVLDTKFPLEDFLIPSVIQAVVKELLGAEYRAVDKTNNATDDTDGISTKVQKNDSRS